MEEVVLVGAAALVVDTLKSAGLDCCWVVSSLEEVTSLLLVLVSLQAEIVPNSNAKEQAKIFLKFFIV